MSATFLVPAAVCEHRIEIQRSRFIARLSRVTSVDQAKAEVAAIQQRFPDATHHCWAYQIGPPGDTRLVGYSDDGEPHGTAGKPMLQVLLHGDVGEVLAIVTRYYGGTKLGKGGLVRAYSSAVKGALDQVKTKRKVDWWHVSVVVSYSQLDPIEQLVESVGGSVLDRDFREEVRLRMAIPRDREAAFTVAVENLTLGAAKLECDPVRDPLT